MQVGLTGQSTTSSVGSLTVNDMTIGLTGQEFTASQGTVTIPNATAIAYLVYLLQHHKELQQQVLHTEASLTGIEFTASLGTVVIPNDVVQISGVLEEFSLGSIVGLGGAVVQPSSLSITPSVGSLTIEEGLGLTGQSFTC